MANQPHNPQQQDPSSKQADGRPGKDARAPKRIPGESRGADGPQPQDPADLGHDPKPADVQSAGRLGQSSEKSRH